MNSTLVLTPATRMTAGILLLTIVAVESGGWLILRIVRGRQPATVFPHPIDGGALGTFRGLSRESL